MIKKLQIIGLSVFLLLTYSCRNNTISSADSQLSGNNIEIDSIGSVAIQENAADLATTHDIKVAAIESNHKCTLYNNSQLVVGEIHSQRNRLIHSFVMKLDRHNNYLWGRILNDENIVVPSKVFQLSNDDILVIGYHTQISGRKYTQVSSDMFIQKISGEGEKKWNKVINIDKTSEEAITAAELEDKSVLILGQQYKSGKFLCCLKIDQNGQILWSYKKQIQGGLANLQITQEKNNIIIAGSLNGQISDSSDVTKQAFKITLNEEGETQDIELPKNIQQSLAQQDKPSIKTLAHQANTITPPSVETITITSSDVIVRSKPSTKSAVMGVLDQNYKCQLLQQSDRQVEIGNMKNYWYKLKYNNIVGWVYGAFIEFNN